MTIRFFSNDDTSADLLKRFLANYSVWDDGLSFTIAENYEFAVVFNSTDEFIHPEAKIITIVQDAFLNQKYSDTTFLTNSDYLIIHDPELFSHNLGIQLGGEIIESPSYTFYSDKVDKTFFHYATATRKVKKLSMIVNELNHVSKRLLNQILASDLDIDVYGSGLVTDDTRFREPVDYNFTALLPYEYAIVIENYREKNYISNKFVDCILCNTIPIYYGAPNISSIYDGRYIRNLDPDGLKVIEDLKKIIKESAPFSSVNKAIYFNEFNLYKKLKEIIL